MLTGRCLCGAIAYEVEAEPQAFAFCHCRDCQYITGGQPSAAVVVPAGSLRLLRGELKTFWTRGFSGAMADRNFCPECGTLIASRLKAQSPFVAVMAGTLDEPPPLQPQMEIWTSTAQPWAHRPEGVTAFERNPG
jgi:hypothetical protein